MTTELKRAYRAVGLAALTEIQSPRATPADRQAMATWVLSQTNLVETLTGAEIDELVQIIKARGAMPSAKRSH
jgi:hypothetical protein